MRAVILTASSMRKEINGSVYSGKCVTAFDLESHRIVRFVRNEQGAPIENPFCNRFHPLDVVEITVYKECPLKCQTENVLADYPNARILGKYEGSIKDIYDLYIRNQVVSQSYMLDGSHKVDDISAFDHSLEIIRVSSLVVEEKKCSFRYIGKRYNYVSVTDPEYTDIVGKTDVGDAFLAVSLPTNDYHGLGYYKFVASIFPV